MWECGLKQTIFNEFGGTSLSLLMWECGLKLFVEGTPYIGMVVTPYVGVWIETR